MRFLVLTTLLFSAVGRPALAVTKAEIITILKDIDKRTTHTVDYKARLFVEEKKPGAPDSVRVVDVYRRDVSDAIVILFQAPKAQRGEGYLRIKRNLWFYDPKTGKWERRTERERIGGTSARRQDFDKSRLALEYDPTAVSEGKLGKHSVYVVALKAKPKADVAYARQKLWIDKKTHNILKREEYAVSGKLLRTSFIPKWKRAALGEKFTDYPERMIIFDEVQKGEQTTLVPKQVEVKPQPAGVFTKAWLEARSR